MTMSLRTRLVLSTLLPMILVVTGLTVLFASRHLADIDHALEQRGRALARQTAAMAEFSLFSGNQDLLQIMALGVLRSDPDLSGMAITDATGMLVAQAGMIDRTRWPAFTEPAKAEDGSEREWIAKHDAGDVIVVPVIQRTLAVDDAYSGAEIAVTARTEKVLGHVVIGISRLGLARDRQRLIIIALLTGLSGALLGGALALGIARGITQPVLAATDVVDRIGHGDLGARVDETQAGPLSLLAHGINAMANKVAITREDLAFQVQEATAALVVQRDAAESATAAKSRFLASASHDLRQPLHALGLFVSRLTKLPWNGEQRSLIRHVELSVSTLQDMLDTLLDISRLDAGVYRTDIQIFEVTPLLEQLTRDMAPLAYSKHLVLRLHSRPCWTYSDPRLVERILMNLISNAIRYTDQGTVVVACRPLGDTLRLQVWDTGQGIPVEMQEAIFDEYVQVGNEERDRSKGLGLGLAICQRIAGALGTQISMRSRLGHGSVFWVDLPLCVPESTQVSASNQVSLRIDSRILIVDDDALCRDATVEAVSGWGAQTLTATDANDALVVLNRANDESELPQIAICDLRLPGATNGMSLAQKLRQTYPLIKIVLITADVNPAVQALARRNGFPILKKPVAPARLRATLLSLLND